LQRSFNKYGEQSFNFTIVEYYKFPKNYTKEYVNDYLLCREYFFIQNLNPEYNIKKDIERGKSLDKYLADAPDFGSTTVRPSSSENISLKKKVSLPSITKRIVEVMDRGSIKDKMIFGISGIEEADYRDGYRKAEEVKEELLKKKFSSSKMRLGAEEGALEQKSLGILSNI
jgi:hypothetical protein